MKTLNSDRRAEVDCRKLLNVNYEEKSDDEESERKLRCDSRTPGGQGEKPETSTGNKG